MANTINDFNIDNLLQIKEHDTEIAEIFEKLEKCYSALRYEEFQKAVEAISIKSLQLDKPKKKIKEYATDATKEYLQNSAWNQINFWVPVIISLGAVIVAYLKK